MKNYFIAILFLVIGWLCICLCGLLSVIQPELVRPFLHVSLVILGGAVLASFLRST